MKTFKFQKVLLFAIAAIAVSCTILQNSTVFADEESAPVIKIKVIRPSYFERVRRIPFLAVVKGDDVVFIEDAVLWLDDIVVPAEVTSETDPGGNILYRVSYVPDYDLTWGPHTYKMQVTYGGIDLFGRPFGADTVHSFSPFRMLLKDDGNILDEVLQELLY